MSRVLEQVLADHRGRAAVLRHAGHPVQADSIEEVCSDVAESMRDYLDWLTEEEAKLASGWGENRLRRAFPAWQAAGMAEFRGEGRQARRHYRRCIVPRRPNLIRAYAEGKRSA
jgi:hypothetical protein